MNCSDKNNIMMAHSFVAVVKKAPGRHDEALRSVRSLPDRLNHYCSSDNNRLEISFALRNYGASESQPDTLLANKGILILGDNSEWSDTQGRECMANGVYIRFDLAKKEISVLTSIVGLPALFIYEEPERIILTSDLYLLSDIDGLDLRFDPEGIVEFCRIGHPIANRTLFSSCSMAPCGYRVEASAQSGLSMSSAWERPTAEPLCDWNEFTDLQIEAFEHAVHSLDLSHTFLSLTAGLDTRAILAELVKENIKVPSLTMSGPVTSLDARTARKLCQAYGIKHDIVLIGEEFCKGLPGYSLEASRLSGGLASIEQASEVFFYRENGTPYSARLSGNLGNQVGRRGTEKVSLRDADTAILDPASFEEAVRGTIEHWYKDAKVVDGRLDYEFLLRNEVPFSSVGNYCIGNHFAVQQSPYSNQRLINNSFLAPMDTEKGKQLSLTQLRLKDLQHRFFGETEKHSFQRKLIRETGGFVASYPINWGWRANGGVSIPGLLRGGLTFLDAVSSSKGLNSGIKASILKTLHISGRHEYKIFELWIKNDMKEFICDTLSSNKVKKSGLFNVKILDRFIEEHYSSKASHYRELVFALDLSLAKQIFRASI